jgi:hypothetical protein
MGYEKDRQIQEMDQGWGFTDTDVCYRCLSDPYLRAMVKDNASKNECSYCEHRSRKPIAIPFDGLMEVIAGAIYQYFDHCVNEAIAWDQEDQEYVGTTYQTYELVRWEIPTPSQREDVLDEITDSLGDNEWCDKTPYALTGADRILSSWEGFCNTVKHETRYFFGSRQANDELDEKIPVAQMLDELRDIIDGAGLIGVIPPGRQFFRIRPHNRTEICNSWDTLGSPPPQVAVSNRMSAAGISVFYAGMELATAKAETTANLSVDDRRCITAGTWTNTRSLNILDLTKLPEVPSFYAQIRYDRDHLIFLQQFVEDITQPVIHDGREHIDYVPTQILTEYFRYQYQLPEKGQLDGIVYPSAQRKRGSSIVVFASLEDLNPSRGYFGSRPVPILTLDQGSVRRVRKGRRTSGKAQLLLTASSVAAHLGPTRS